MINSQFIFFQGNSFSACRHSQEINWGHSIFVVNLFLYFITIRIVVFPHGFLLGDVVKADGLEIEPG